MPVVTRGAREVSLRFETFPSRAREKIEERITNLTQALEARIQAAAPFRTGKLRSEITQNIYDDSPSRVAGYVSVFAPGSPGEYPKAATLEYGSSKPRRIFERSGSIAARLAGGKRRIVARMTKPAQIRAFAYLRGPFEEMRPQVEAELGDALLEATAEDAAE